MKTIIALGLFAFVAACNNSCVTTPSPAPPKPPPVVVVDAGPMPTPPLDAAPAPQPDIDPGVRDACANLAALQCPEGLAADCKVVLQKAFVQRITIVPLDCLVGATSKPVARACGFVTCP